MEAKTQASRHLRIAPALVANIRPGQEKGQGAARAWAPDGMSRDPGQPSNLLETRCLWASRSPAFEPWRMFGRVRYPVALHLTSQAALRGWGG